MNPERRRLVRKSLLEAAVSCWRIVRMRRTDSLLITCLLPPALILVELFKRLFPRRRVTVMIHGEIEGLFEADRQHPGSYGYYMNKWIGLRRKHSTLGLAVIDDFIVDEMVASSKGAIRPDDITVIPHPITPLAEIMPVDQDEDARICFIGFRTRQKGYDIFERVAATTPALTFEAIGGGYAQSVPGNQSRALCGTGDYMRAIAACDFALFPYVAGYRASLSAAALDALSAGLHLIASRRGCFINLHRNLGPDFVTLFDGEDQLRALLADPDWIAARREARMRRLRTIAHSPYGETNITKALARLTEPEPTVRRAPATKSGDRA
jgi:glycosyltransferase involved in cell wall biosynthesis